MKIPALSAFLLALPLSGLAASVPVKITCELVGLTEAKPPEFISVVDGSWAFDPSVLKPDPPSAGGGCRPVKRSSKVFGGPSGTRFQITASKCGSDEAYYSAVIHINGLPVTVYLDRGANMLRFNSGWNGPLPAGTPAPAGELLPEKSLTLPEGNFLRLDFSCGVE